MTLWGRVVYDPKGDEGRVIFDPGESKIHCARIIFQMVKVLISLSVGTIYLGTPRCHKLLAEVTIVLANFPVLH
jgi:hypothetical protein